MKLLSELLMFHCRLDMEPRQLCGSYRNRGEYIVPLYESVPWLLDEKLDRDHSILLDLIE